MLRPLLRRIAITAILLLLIACNGSSPKRATKASVARPTTSLSLPATTAASSTTTTTTPIATTTTAVESTTTAAAAFTGSISTVSVADLGSSYRAGCPVGPAALRKLRVSYWGFDNRAHIGAIVVNASVAQEIVTVFATLLRARFPIRRMETVDVFGSDDRASMAADNTSGFNCRSVAGSSPPRWSAHAYGLAIDINTIENPYVSGSLISPPAGAAYLDRRDLRPGMAGPGSAVNDAFAAAGWFWGGRWASPDYQHFSKSGG